MDSELIAVLRTMSDRLGSIEEVLATVGDDLQELASHVRDEADRTGTQVRRNTNAITQASARISHLEQGPNGKAAEG